MTPPPGGRRVTQAVELCLQAGSYSSLPPQRGSTARVPLPQQALPVSSPQEEGPRGVSLQRPYCFALHRQSPCLSLWRKAKTLQLNDSCPPPPKNTVQETLGKRILPSEHVLAKTHQEFPIKVPFYLPLKRFSLFVFRTSLPQNETHHHAHTKQQLNNLK